LLASTGVVSVVISVLDFTGILDNVSWLAQRVPALTLLAVGFVASYLILERLNTLRGIGESLDEHDERVLQAISTAVRSLDGVEVRRFANSSDLLRYFLRKADKAHYVDDITWSDKVAVVSQKERKDFEYYRQQIKSIASKPDVVWREIVIFISPERFVYVKDLLESNPEGYNVAYYDVSQTSGVPRVTFSVIDKKEVIIAGYGVYLAVRHPDIVEYFQRYYESLWSNAKNLKVGSSINRKELERLISLYLS